MEENNNSEEKVKAMYGETSAIDVSLPDMLVPPPPEKEEKKEVDKVNKKPSSISRPNIPRR